MLMLERFLIGVIDAVECDLPSDNAITVKC